MAADCICQSQDTRSIVSFADDRRLVGEAAASQLRSNIVNTAVELPRLAESLAADVYPASRHTVTDTAIEALAIHPAVSCPD